ncbi:MAG: hypothetical protein RR922_00650 [Clostridia bacterium]
MILNDNSEIQEYFEILAGNEGIPEFITKYLNTETMKRLKGVGHFCGIDYNLFPSHELKYWYSRYDHSIAVALIVWQLTKDKKETIVALLHDAGTPIFSHCVDYMYGDSEKQISSEKNLLDMIAKDQKLIEALELDKMEATDFKDITQYRILENEGPKLCADRLESVLCTNYIWNKLWTMKEIKEIYSAIQVGINENKNKEIAFNNEEVADKFYEGAYKYSFLLQQNENKLSMLLIGNILKETIDNGIITEKNMYKMTEKDFINTLMKHEKSKALKMWNELTKITFVGRSDIVLDGVECLHVKAKKRYVDPLVWKNGEYLRGKTASKYIANRINNIQFLKDSTYFYIVENL